MLMLCKEDLQPGRQQAGLLPGSDGWASYSLVQPPLTPTSKGEK